MDFSPLWISLKVAVCATVYTFFLGLLSARLVLSLRAGKALIDGIFSLPMVLPPTVVGFFLLIIFGKNSLLGGLLLKMGISVLFTWQGAVIAAVVVSFPIDTSARRANAASAAGRRRMRRASRCPIPAWRGPTPSRRTLPRKRTAA